MRFKNIFVKEILDSRSEPTIEVCLLSDDDKNFCAQIPSGKSRGANEASVFSPDRVKKSLENVKQELIGKNFNSTEELDAFLLKTDNTPKKEKLGGNFILGISIAGARAMAAEYKQELWQFLRDEFFKENNKENSPLIFSNLINGGAHAKNNLSIQEYLVVTETNTNLKESIENLKTIYNALGNELKKSGQLDELPLGDEGGFSTNFNDDFQPLKILEHLIVALGFEDKMKLGLDVAANNFYQQNYYKLGGKKLSAEDLVKIYQEYFSKINLLFSLEDPFAETDFEAFRKLRLRMPDALIIGDDLTTTNPKTIRESAEKGLINGVIIKPNQIGTITETILAIKAARSNNLKVIISHRSGETDDVFIIQLAKACGADGVKIGAPVRERLLKFGELIRIYQN
ncbi:hypothetical protein C4553_03700 [Candidatus Parcubacteria bacterium]|nr:MAG: hypothetical protein C4553_03700 [Candidatus Parcubacteria bacterium]